MEGLVFEDASLMKKLPLDIPTLRKIPTLPLSRFHDKKMGSTSLFLTRHLETGIKWKERKGSPGAPTPQGVIRPHLSFSPAAFLANRDATANGRATELYLLKYGSPK